MSTVTALQPSGGCAARGGDWVRSKWQKWALMLSRNSHDSQNVLLVVVCPFLLLLSRQFVNEPYRWSWKWRAGSLPQRQTRRCRLQTSGTQLHPLLPACHMKPLFLWQGRGQELARAPCQPCCFCDKSLPLRVIVDSERTCAIFPII